MSNIDNDNGRDFRLRLAKRESSNRHVTPEDMLSVALEELRSGALPMDQVLIAYRVPEEDGDRVGYFSANMNRAEQLAMMLLVQDQVIQGWKTG